MKLHESLAQNHSIRLQAEAETWQAHDHAQPQLHDDDGVQHGQPPHAHAQ